MDDFGEKAKIEKERRVLEKNLVDIGSKKIKWWWPWSLVSVLYKLQDVIPLVGTITASSLEKQLDLYEAQEACFGVIVEQQDVIADLEKRIIQLEKKVAEMEE